MKLILDERETLLFDKCNELLLTASNKNNSNTVITEKKVMVLGDIEIQTNDNKPLLLFERKSIQDLLASIKDGRYEEQSYRLKHSTDYHPHNIVYIIEGMFSQIRTPQEKKMVLSAITSIQYFKGFSVLRTCSMQETAELMVSMADKIDRNFQKGMVPFFSVLLPPPPKEEEEPNIQESSISSYCTVVKKVKKENLTHENMGEIILCQIPGISSTTAIAVMKHVNHSLITLIDILQKDSKSLETLKIGGGKQRRISKKNVENMQLFLCYQQKVQEEIS